MNYYTITIYNQDLQILSQHDYESLSQARRELRLLKSLLTGTRAFATLIY